MSEYLRADHPIPLQVISVIHSLVGIEVGGIVVRRVAGRVVSTTTKIGFKEARVVLQCIRHADTLRSRISLVVGESLDGVAELIEQVGTISGVVAGFLFLPNIDGAGQGT